jgi:hypothetical protein
MGDNCKYVVVKKGARLIPVVFSAAEDHEEMAGLIGGEVVSAGFADFRGTVRTLGRSSSLGKGPAEGDDSLLRIFLNVEGGNE